MNFEPHSPLIDNTYVYIYVNWSMLVLIVKQVLFKCLWRQKRECPDFKKIRMKIFKRYWCDKFILKNSKNKKFMKKKTF